MLFDDFAPIQIMNLFNNTFSCSWFDDTTSSDSGWVNGRRTITDDKLRLASCTVRPEEHMNKAGQTTIIKSANNNNSNKTYL